MQAHDAIADARLSMEVQKRKGARWLSQYIVLILPIFIRVNIHTCNERCAPKETSTLRFKPHPALLQLEGASNVCLACTMLLPYLTLIREVTLGAHHTL